MRLPVDRHLLHERLHVPGRVGPGPFYAQTASERSVDHLYFSFVTLTTVGYGDLTPIADLGRMIAVSEALIGQLFLVTVVALVVGNIGRTRLK